ncbi:MAG: hypothetical protein QM790_00930 [Nibricoccus sp.]
MKKTSKTATTTPATPAPVPAKKSTAKAAKAPAQKAIGLAPAQKAPAPALAPAVKSSPAAAVSTKITAKIDVGFGNTLYIRGEGPGLSWEKGIPLDCVADDQWSLTLADASRPVVFKFLINDLTWCIGDDFVVQPGGTTEITPVF